MSSNQQFAYKNYKRSVSLYKLFGKEDEYTYIYKWMRIKFPYLTLHEGMYSNSFNRYKDEDDNNNRDVIFEYRYEENIVCSDYIKPIFNEYTFETILYTDICLILHDFLTKELKLTGKKTRLKRLQW